jgi:hypothetical protein
LEFVIHSVLSTYVKIIYDYVNKGIEKGLRKEKRKSPHNSLRLLNCRYDTVLQTYIEVIVDRTNDRFVMEARMQRIEASKGKTGQSSSRPSVQIHGLCNITY